MSTRLLVRLLSVLSIGVFLVAVPIASAQRPKYKDPEKADADFALQGEYAPAEDPQSGPAVQVIALGDGAFEAVVYEKGLPGTQKAKQKPQRLQAKREGDKIVFTDGNKQLIVDGKQGQWEVDGKSIAAKKVTRQSPTLGKKPPTGAVVLFDGSSADQWKNGKLDDGLLSQGTTSIPTFGSHRLHIEFRLPYEPFARGQGRGNSGIYVQGRYEVQMLDSFGLQGKQNECGGLYSVKAPDFNMCFPPLTWQTYDIDYQAARFDDAGKLTANPRVTVRHNGVLIHDDVELPGNRSTTAAPSKPGPSPGPIYLQDHGSPVRYRNIWVVETDK